VKKLIRNKKTQKGFTLIELLVVIAIIGLLASVVLLALNSARAKSRDAKRLADIRQMSTALELYYNENGGYPAAAASLAPNYIGALPTAPTPNDGPCTSGNNTYTYTTTGTGFGSPVVYPGYAYTFCLGAATGGYASGIHSSTPQGIQ
jgi:type II secretion system protein G